MKIARIAAVAVLGLAASTAAADEKTTNRYDAQGRLTAVAIARSSSGSGYVRYAYDDADNRDVRRAVVLPVRAASNELRSGESLVPQESIFSTDGRFELRFRLEGDLVLYFGSTVLWSTPASTTALGSSMVLNMQPDGNFVLYDYVPSALWASNTSAYPGGFLRVQNDGNVVIYQGGVARWSTNTCCH